MVANLSPMTSCGRWPVKTLLALFVVFSATGALAAEPRTKADASKAKPGQPGKPEVESAANPAAIKQIIKRLEQTGRAIEGLVVEVKAGAAAADVVKKAKAAMQEELAKMEHDVTAIYDKLNKADKQVVDAWLQQNLLPKLAELQHLVEPAAGAEQAETPDEETESPALTQAKALVDTATNQIRQLTLSVAQTKGDAAKEALHARFRAALAQVQPEPPAWSTYAADDQSAARAYVQKELKPVARSFKIALYPQGDPHDPPPGPAMKAAMEAVDKLVAMVEKVVLEVEAAGDSDVKIKAIIDKFKSQSESFAAQAETLIKALNEEEKSELDLYGREKIAPLMERFMAAMTKAQHMEPVDEDAALAPEAEKVDKLPNADKPARPSKAGPKKAGKK